MSISYNYHKIFFIWKKVSLISIMIIYLNIFSGLIFRLRDWSTILVGFLLEEQILVLNLTLMMIFLLTKKILIYSNFHLRQKILSIRFVDIYWNCSYLLDNFIVKSVKYGKRNLYKYLMIYKFKGLIIYVKLLLK